jgi:Tfp pilus assembly protein PilV
VVDVDVKQADTENSVATQGYAFFCARNDEPSRWMVIVIVSASSPNMQVSHTQCSRACRPRIIYRQSIWTEVMDPDRKLCPITVKSVSASVKRRFVLTEKIVNRRKLDTTAIAPVSAPV